MVDGRTCPSCGRSKSVVRQTRWAKKLGFHARTRECKCGRQWRTIEVYAEAAKHGKWIDRQKAGGTFQYRWACSDCGGTASEASRYCPNCGLEMEEEDERQRL